MKKQTGHKLTDFILWMAGIDLEKQFNEAWEKHSIKVYDCDCLDKFGNPYMIPIEKETEGGLKKGSIIL